jgi:broad specificity phosphatase PhoE
VCHLLGITQDHWRQIRLDNASLSIVDTYQRGAIISLLNDTSHLRGIG